MVRTKYLNFNGFTLSGKKLSDSDWRKPTISFGFYNYKPSLTIRWNVKEPIGKAEWKENITTFKLDVNGIGIFAQKALTICNNGEDNKFTAIVKESKFLEDGTYVPNEFITTGSISFMFMDGHASLLVQTTKRSQIFDFGNVFRIDFKDRDDSDLDISKEDAIAKMGMILDSVNNVQLLLASLESEERQ